MADADREVIVRVGAEVAPSVKAAAERVRKEIKEAATPPAADPAVEASWQRILKKAEEIRKAKETGASLSQPEAETLATDAGAAASDMADIASKAQHAAAAFADIQQAASAISRGDLPATATNVMQIARHAQMAGVAMGAVGGAVAAVGVGLYAFEATGNALRKMSQEGLRAYQVFENLKWKASTGGISEVRQIAAEAENAIAQLNGQRSGRGMIARLIGTPADWKEGVRSLVFGKDNIFSQKVRGSGAAIDEDAKKQQALRSLAIERELELQREVADAEQDRFRDSAVLMANVRQAFETEVFQKEQLLRLSNDLTETDRRNIQEQIRLINGRKEARLREIEIAGKYPEIEAEVDKAFAADPPGDFGRTRSGATKDAQRERDARQRMEVADQEQRDRLQRANVLDELEDTAEETLRITRATAGLEGEQLEIAKLRLYWEEKIALAKKQGGAEGERVARGLEEARDAEIATVQARRETAAAKAATRARQDEDVARYEDLRHGRVPHYTDVGGITRERRGSMIDEGGGPLSRPLGSEEGGWVDARGRPLPNVGPMDEPGGPKSSMPERKHPFADWKSQAAMDQARKEAREGNKEMVRERAEAEGISQSDARKALRKEGRLIEPNPVDPDIKKKADEAAAAGSGGKTLDDLYTMLDKIERKLPTGVFS